MDAQEITFNQDPEAAATEDIETQKSSSCCCNIVCCPCKVFYWYIAPLTCEICHTLKCFFFHPFNFGFAIFLLVWDTTLIPLGLGLIALCCMGIPLLWCTFETIVACSRIDLAFNYYFVETTKKLDKSREHLLKLTLYYTDIPLCCCYNNAADNCFNVIWDRMKYLMTEPQVYKYIIFHILIRPIVTFSTWWICIIVTCHVSLIGVPFWYLSNDEQFKRDQISPTWWAYSTCGWKTEYDDNGERYKALDCDDDDHVWIINTFGDAFAFGLLMLILLPLTLRVNNWFASWNKAAAYRFYTYYYSDDAELNQEKQPMIKGADRMNSV